MPRVDLFAHIKNYFKIPKFLAKIVQHLEICDYFAWNLLFVKLFLMWAKRSTRGVFNKLFLDISGYFQIGPMAPISVDAGNSGILLVLR